MPCVPWTRGEVGCLGSLTAFQRVKRVTNVFPLPCPIDSLLQRTPPPVLALVFVHQIFRWIRKGFYLFPEEEKIRHTLRIAKGEIKCRFSVGSLGTLTITTKPLPLFLPLVNVEERGDGGTAFFILFLVVIYIYTF